MPYKLIDSEYNYIRTDIRDIESNFFFRHFYFYIYLDGFEVNYSLSVGECLAVRCAELIRTFLLSVRNPFLFNLSRVYERSYGSTINHRFNLVPVDLHIYLKTYPVCLHLLKGLNSLLLRTSLGSSGY